MLYTLFIFWSIPHLCRSDTQPWIPPTFLSPSPLISLSSFIKASSFWHCIISSHVTLYHFAFALNTLFEFSFQSFSSMFRRVLSRFYTSISHSMIYEVIFLARFLIPSYIRVWFLISSSLLIFLLINQVV